MSGKQLSDLQKEILRYRKLGLSQQQIADIIHTSRSNICVIEKSARENIRLAKNTLDDYYTLDARYLCTLQAGSDLFDSVTLIFGEAGKIGIHMAFDPIDLINQLREENLYAIRGRLIREDIKVFLRDDGKIYSG